MFSDNCVLLFPTQTLHAQYMQQSLSTFPLYFICSLFTSIQFLFHCQDAYW